MFSSTRSKVITAAAVAAVIAAGSYGIIAATGGDTATQVPGQVRDQITSKLAAGREPTHAAWAAGRGRSTSGAAHSTPRRSLESGIRDRVKSSTASQEAVGTAGQPILCAHTSHPSGHL